MSINAINAFKSYVTGVQRPTMFDVVLAFSSTNILGNILTKQGNQSLYGSEDNDKMININSTTDYSMSFAFTCKSADFPEDTIGTIEVPYMGRKVKFFGDRQYSDWNTTLIVDNEWSVYHALYDWHVSMNGPRNIIGASRNMNDYKANAYVTCYGNDGQSNITAYLVGLWPSSIQTINLDWDTTDTAMEVQVTWAYDYSILGKEPIPKKPPKPYYEPKPMLNTAGSNEPPHWTREAKTGSNATWMYGAE